jgi:hypothetical protein
MLPAGTENDGGACEELGFRKLVVDSGYDVVTNLFFYFIKVFFTFFYYFFV